jgi:hypothetical protein
MVNEEYKGCENCFYDDCEVYEYPCARCKNNLCTTDPNYDDAPFFWLDKYGGHSSTVNHPTHYNQGGIECIDAMIAAFGKEAVENFCLVNAFKYVWRNRDKNGFEDIDKAIWYLNKVKELNASD